MNLHIVSKIPAAVVGLLLAAGNGLTDADDFIQSQPVPAPQPPLAESAFAPPVDLVAKGVVIGGQFINVGAAETLHTYRAKAFSNGKCLFGFEYNVKNQGAAKTPVPFRNVVLWDTGIIAQHAGQILNGGVSRDYFFDAWLEPGSHLLTLRADADQAVQESDETNNQRITRVVVMGACTDSFTTRPAAPVKRPTPESVPAAMKAVPSKLR